MPKDKVYEILVVEDNPADARLIEMAREQWTTATTNVPVLEKSKGALLPAGR